MGIKARSGDIKKLIEDEIKKNNGKAPRIFGANGWQSVLTLKNWEKILNKTNVLTDKK